MSEDLKYAISWNDLKKIQEILCTTDVDLNNRFRSYSPLLNACVKGSPVIVGALVKAGANVNVRVSHDKITLPKYSHSLNSAICSNGSKTVTPLILGVADRNLELVKKLLQDCGADVNAANDAALTPLHFIPTNDVDYWGSTDKAQVKPEVAQLLLKAGAEVDALDGKGQTPLHRAVIANDLESTQILLENGARVDIADREGSTALHIAAHEHNTQLCQLLIQHEGGKTAVNHKARDGATPLHVAIESTTYAPDEKEMAVVQLLIDNGADLTSQKHGLTPLHLAAEARRPLDIVKMLVEAGADIRAEALKTGLTPLDMAKHTNRHKVVAYLVKKATERENYKGGRSKRDSPSVEQEDNVSSQQTDTPVEDIAPAVGGFQLLNIKAEDSVVHVEGLGAVGGFQQLVIKDEDSSDDDL